MASPGCASPDEVNRLSSFSTAYGFRESVPDFTERISFSTFRDLRRGSSTGDIAGWWMGNPITLVRQVGALQEHHERRDMWLYAGWVLRV